MTAVHPERATHSSVRPRIDALDGIRGLAVVAVLAFHLDLSWARGGYLGVSTFFTLSGYLITSLLEAEHRRTGGVAMARFWGRRVRRLLPLSLVGVVLAALAASRIGVTTSTRGDLLAALGNVSNWRFLLDGHSYGDLFSAPSPVLHYWSLAVEWQLYLVFPFLALATLRRSRLAFHRALVAACAVSWGALVVLVLAGEGDAAYYATLTRAGEVFAGGVLAVARRRGRHAAAAPAASVRTTVGGMAALAVLVVAVGTIGTQPDGGHVLALPLVALASTALIAAATRPGPLAAALSLPVLVRLGAWSYALYVVHWPIFLWLSPARTGLGSVTLVALRLAVTFAVAVALHRAVERPVLHGRPLPDRVRRFAVVGGAYVAAVALGLGLIARGPVAQDLEAEARDLEVAASSAEPVEPVGNAPPPPSLAFFGDSTAVMVGIGMKIWQEEGGPFSIVPGAVELGCGIELPGRRRVGPDREVLDKPDHCEGHLASWGPLVAEHQPTAAVIQVGVWEATDQQVAGSEVWQHLGQPEFDRLTLELLGAKADELLQAGAEHIVWITAPPIDPTLNPSYRGSAVPEADPARFQRFNELVVEMASTRPQVEIVDLAAHLAALPEAELARIRPDGTHFTRETAAALTREWLGPEILATLR